ncbi:MAG: hypothetical protein WC370_04835 [Dehalococcoidales bacterium]|jgi:hypothetical protein
MKKIISPIIVLLLGLGLQLLGVIPVQADGPSLRVRNGICDIDVQAGQSYTHEIFVSSKANDPALIVNILSAGFGQNLDGIYEVLDEIHDISPFTALPYISNIENASFTLKGGEEQEAKFTIKIPDDFNEDGTLYALIYVLAYPESSMESMDFAQGIKVPVILTPVNAGLTHQGEITDLMAETVPSGEPIPIQTIVKNTGNHHYKAYNALEIRNSSGEMVISSNTSLTTSSIVPEFSFRFTQTLQEGLPAGKYRMKSSVYHPAADASGNTVDELIDSREAEFEVLEPLKEEATPTLPPDEQERLLRDYGNTAVLGDMEQEKVLAFPWYTMIAVFASVVTVGMTIFIIVSRRRGR